MARALLPACGCSGKKPRPAAAPHPEGLVGPREGRAVPYDEEWQKTSFGGMYIAPIDGFADGAYDLIFHFHAGKFASAEYRELAAPIGVVVRLDYGAGTGPYEDAFKDPARFQ